MLDESTLLVFWEEPYTADQFPIVRYFLEVEGNQTLLEDRALSADTHSFNYTKSPLTECAGLTFQVRAQNSQGNSSGGVVQGAFPNGESK